MTPNLIILYVFAVIGVMTIGVGVFFLGTRLLERIVWWWRGRKELKAALDLFHQSLNKPHNHVWTPPCRRDGLLCDNGPCYRSCPQ